MYRCPKCKDADNLVISADVLVRLIQPSHDPEAFETEEVEGGGPEWGSDHGCRCIECGHHGNVSDFEVHLVPEGTTFKLTLRTANTLAAGLRIMQALLAADESFLEMDGVTRMKVGSMEHFDGTEGTGPVPSHAELEALIDAIYDGSVLDKPCKDCGRLVASLNVAGSCEGGCEEGGEDAEEERS